MAHHTVLRNLVEKYERYERMVGAHPSDKAARRNLEDTAYTLCVSTGTRDIAAALAAARSALTRTAVR